MFDWKCVHYNNIYFRSSHLLHHILFWAYNICVKIVVCCDWCRVRFPLDRTHLWVLVSSYSSSSLYQLLLCSEVSNLHLALVSRAACLLLHCPCLFLQALQLSQQPYGMVPGLCHVARMGWTATLLAGTRLVPPGTVSHLVGMSVVLAPGTNWRSLCRPGSQVSDAGRRRPAGRSVDRFRGHWQGEELWHSPKEHCQDESSSCSC